MSELLREAISAAERAVAGEDSGVQGYVERLLDDSRGLQSSDTDDRVYLAALLDATGLHEEATSVLHDPTDPRSGNDVAILRNMEGMLAAAHGEHEQARHLLREALSEAGSSPALSVKILANLAAVALQAGSLEEAEAWADASGALAEPGTSAADVLIATVRASIASERGDLPSLSDAAAWLGDMSRARIRELGTHHPQALALIANLARTEMLVASADGSPGRLERAIDVLEVAALRLAAELGTDHPRSLAAKASLEAALASLGTHDVLTEKTSASTASVEVGQLGSDLPSLGVLAPQSGDASSAAPARSTQPPGLSEDTHAKQTHLNQERSSLRKAQDPRRMSQDRKNVSHFGDFFAWLGGGDTGILEHLPEERAQFVQMAAVLLTTAGIAAISMMFAVHDGIGSSSPVAIVLGLLWGVVILNLDRFLVLSMARTRNRRQLISMALPRLLLAGVLALIISTPLVLRIFASDINAQLTVLHQQRTNQLSEIVANSTQAKQANQLLVQVNADRSILAGQLPNLPVSPELQSAQAEVNKLQAEVKQSFAAETAARETWQCQVDGGRCNGASGMPGNGPIAQADYLQLQQAISTYDSLKSELATAEAAENTVQARLSQSQNTLLVQLQAQARTELPILQGQYNSLQRELRSQAYRASSINNADTGILAQLSALSEASASSPTLEVARTTVLALFFLIEILPVTVKFLLNMGPKSAYEFLAERQDEQAARLAQIRLDEEKRIAQDESEHRINVESQARKREESLGQQANQYIAKEIEEILGAAAEEWRTAVRSRLAQSSGGR